VHLKDLVVNKSANAERPVTSGNSHREQLSNKPSARGGAAT
jgi:hypothetical protein